MRKGDYLLAAAAAVAFTGTAYAQSTSTLEQDAIAFGMLGTAQSADLSPDGTKVVYVGPGPSSTKLAYLADLGTGTSKPILRTTNDADHLSSCGFSSNTRVICTYSGNFAEDGTVVSYSRIVALNADASNIQQLGNTTAQFGICSCSRKMPAFFSNMREVQSEVGSGPHVVEGSPVNAANRIAAPVLLVHADRDVNVDIQHSDKMEAALKHAGKDVEYYRIKGLDHQLADGSVRATLLLKMGQLLDRTIGH